MKKSIKILSAVVLLALAISAFALLGAFAEETEGPTEIYSIGSSLASSSTSMSGVTYKSVTVDGKQAMSFTSTSPVADRFFTPTGFGKSTVRIRDFDADNQA